MGNHRADDRDLSRRRSESTPETYVGRRIARREPAPAPTSEQTPTHPRTAESPVTPELPAVVPEAPAADEHPAVAPQIPTITVDLPALTDPAAAFGATTTGSLRPAVPGKRRAVKHVGSARTPLLRGLPSMPVVVGVATLAIAAGGVLTSNDPQLVGGDASRIGPPNAATGAIGTGTFDVLGRSPVMSRDSDREALNDASDAELVKEAEKQAEQRNVRLSRLTEQAQREAQEISLNRWVLPIDAGIYRMTAQYGDYGLWASYHTGQDFAAPTGTQIKAISNGTVTSASYDGAYGNKTVITLEDGTELWFCHQTAFAVSEGDTVVAGQVIGYVGSTGRVTGPHLHLEVRPGGGDPVDPVAALIANGVTP